MISTDIVLRYPKKSHRKQITIPEQSEHLAEFIGIVFGDGEISKTWQVVISLNSILDKNYAVYVNGLIKNLFGIEASTWKRKGENTLKIVCSSTNVVNFLVSIGAVRGNKIKNGISMPDWISQNSLYKKHFVKGLVDTDGGLYIHKHIVGGNPQRNLGFCFTSLSPKLLIQVADILRENSIIPHITNEGQRIYLYSAIAVKKYLNIFGSSNDRLINVFKEWERLKMNKINFGRVA